MTKSLRVGSLRVGFPGLLLLLCAFFLLRARLNLQPLLGLAPNPETPNLSASEIRSHLMMLTGLAWLCASGSFLGLSLSAFLRRPAPGPARAVTAASLLLRLVVLALWALLMWSYLATLLQRGLTTGGERSFTLATLTTLGGLPLIILTWMALGRLQRWMTLHRNWNGTPPGSLQRQYRLLNGSWRLLAVLLPLVLMDIPHPKANTVSTLLDKTVIAQQKPLMLTAMLALLSAGTCAWFTRPPLAEYTAALDETKSRIGQYLKQPTKA